MERVPAPKTDQKTVLIVDDNPMILAFVSGLLVDDKYNVLCAGSGAEAMLKANAYEQEIDLLLSDFEMPGMTGVELATALMITRPLLKVLLMSGFLGGMLVLNEGWHFLAKPFIPSQLRALIVGLVSPEKRSSSI